VFVFVCLFVFTFSEVTFGVGEHSKTVKYLYFLLLNLFPGFLIGVCKGKTVEVKRGTDGNYEKKFFFEKQIINQTESNTNNKHK
jgi:hypothetical protein